MSTLVVVDGENVLSKKLINKIKEMRDITPIVVLGGNQKIKGYDYETIGVVQVNFKYPNAVDFVVTSVVAHRMAYKKHCNAIIVSDDNDYRSAVDYLNYLGYNVKRLGYNEFLSSEEDRKFNRLISNCCGYIKNNVEKGTAIGDFNRAIKNQFGRNGIKLSNYLYENGIVWEHEGEVQFSKRRMLELSSRDND